MATSILEKVNIEKAAKNIKVTAGKINKEAMNVSEDLVDGAITAGEEWTKVFGKALKAGTVLLGKQQDLVLDTLEGVKGQYKVGSKRTAKLFGFKPFAKRVKKAAKSVKKNTAKKAKQTIDEVLDAAIKTEKTVKPSAKKIAKKVAKKKAVVKKAVAKKAVAKKVATKKAVVKKAVAKKVTVKKTAKKVVKATVKNDLKKVVGIGPKMEMILNKKGITSFKQLADTKITTLRTIVEEAGPRYRMLDPKTWSKQAKSLAKK